MPSKHRSLATTTTTLVNLCSDVDSTELRLILDELVGGPGQYHHYSNNLSKLYLPLGGSSCQLELTVSRKTPKKIVNMERGPALHVNEWNRLVQKIDTALRNGPKKIGRDYSFSNLGRVVGSWKGERSGVQILPPPADAPRPPALMSEHPFVLEFPITASDSWRVTNHRRMREHRKLTLLLGVLLAGRTSFQPRRSAHFWANVRQDTGPDEIKWVQQLFYAPLGESVLDTLSPRADEQLAEIDPKQYYANVGNDLQGLRVPADLDDSIDLYGKLSLTNRAKFDRATFWYDMASRQWSISMSASFAALVSAIESLTDRGNSHPVKCTTCNKDIEHEVPGATQRFKNFLKDYASDPGLAKQRDEMYSLRSAILHGSDLTQLDQDFAIAHAVDPVWENELELHRELWVLTRVALRNWIKNPPS